MSRPYFSVKHVESMSLLPEKLTPGRIYFIDDEQVIVIDHGNGLPPVIYGGKPGPQGASGEPQPFLQDEINTLAQTELAMQAIIWNEGEKFRKELARLGQVYGETFARLQDMSETNAHTLMSLASVIKTSFENYDSAIATLGKAVANLYPDGTYHSDDDDTPSDTPAQAQLLAQTLNVGDTLKFSGADYRVNGYNIDADGAISLRADSQGSFSDKTDPLDDEVVDTSSGTYTIQQTTYSDGSTLLDLTPAATIKQGDTISANGKTYTVSGVTRAEDGTISVALN